MEDLASVSKPKPTNPPYPSISLMTYQSRSTGLLALNLCTCQYLVTYVLFVCMYYILWGFNLSHQKSNVFVSGAEGFGYRLSFAASYASSHRSIRVAQIQAHEDRKHIPVHTYMHTYIHLCLQTNCTYLSSSGGGTNGEDL